ENGDIILNEGDFHVVPKGVMHNPQADEECWIVLVETVTTTHAGETEAEHSKTIEEQLAGRSF
nr:cupin domain-containing protein [Hyphomicrobiales bacterium]